jgi:hypothetical protein
LRFFQIPTASFKADSLRLCPDWSMRRSMASRMISLCFFPSFFAITDSSERCLSVQYICVLIILNPVTVNIIHIHLPDILSGPTARFSGRMVLATRCKRWFDGVSYSSLRTCYFNCRKISPIPALIPSDQIHAKHGSMRANIKIRQR